MYNGFTFRLRWLWKNSTRYYFTEYFQGWMLHNFYHAETSGDRNKGKILVILANAEDQNDVFIDCLSHHPSPRLTITTVTSDSICAVKSGKCLSCPVKALIESSGSTCLTNSISIWLSSFVLALPRSVLRPRGHGDVPGASGPVSIPGSALSFWVTWGESSVQRAADFRVLPAVLHGVLVNTPKILFYL